MLSPNQQQSDKSLKEQGNNLTNHEMDSSATYLTGKPCYKSEIPMSRGDYSGSDGMMNEAEEAAAFSSNPSMEVDLFMMSP